MIRTRNERNAKQMIIVTISVIAIFTMVHRRSSRCSRNGLGVSLSGSSRNLKMSRRAIEAACSAPLQPNETAGGEAGAHPQSVSIANFIVCDHSSNFRDGEGATIQDRFGFFLVIPFGR